MENLVSFKKAPSVKFNRNEAVLLQRANKLMEKDFEGMGCDPKLTKISGYNLTLLWYQQN